MPAAPCARHPKELTYVRCARCETPICVRCMVDTPVGKKCRDCAANRTHLSESSPRQVGLAFLAALAVALPLGWIVQQLPLFLLAFPYGYAVGEAALRAAARSRSPAVQVVTGLAALAGGVGGAAFNPGWVAAGAEFPLWTLALRPAALLITGIGVAVAVSRVRYI